MAVSITSFGIVSALGLNLEGNLNSLKNSESGVKPSHRNVSYAESIPLGLVKATDEELRSQCGLQTNETQSRTTLLGLKAAIEAWSIHKFNDEIKTGMVGSSCLHSLDLIEKLINQNESLSIANHGEILKQYPGDFTTNVVAKHLGIISNVSSISTACSSAANAIMMGARMINNGIVDRVLVGGSDGICNYGIQGFGSLRLLDTSVCKPFDENRNGLNLGEGAAYLVLESERSMKISGNKPIASLLGWANANDAYHQTTGSPEAIGATLAMKEALETAKLRPEEIDYVNAHGTATTNNDRVESTAIKNIFSENIPATSSTKWQTGHTLAAAGAIEAVFSLLSIQEQKVWANNHRSINEETILPESETSDHAVNNVLSNSFGFGGNCTSLIFGK